VLTDPIRSAAVRLALAKGRVAAAPSGPLRAGGSASVIYVPVYGSIAPAGSSQGDNDLPMGILAFRLSISPTIDAIVQALEPVPRDIDMYVLDDGAPVDHRIIYYRPARQVVGSEHAPDEAAALVDPIYGSSLTFAGRDWTVIVRRHRSSWPRRSRAPVGVS